MGRPKSYSVIIVPGDHSGTRQFRISRRLLVSSVTLLAIASVTIAGFVVTYGSILHKSRRVDDLERQNQNLRSQLATLHELTQQLEGLSALRAQVVAMLGSDRAGEVDPVTPAAQAQADLALAWSRLENVEQLYADEARQPFAPRAWPLPGRVSQEFFAAAEGGRPAHPGLDLLGEPDAPVRSAANGSVVEIGHDRSHGSFVLIDHGFGYRTFYGGVERVAVEVGQEVEQTQVIAYLGPGKDRRGRSRTPHVYFELRVDGRPVDPRSYLTPR